MEALIKLFEVNPNQPLSVERIIVTLITATALGIGILLIYRFTFRGVLFNRSFGTALLLIAVITAMVILPISSNLVLSLGMVGALSIVRFRTALKDPLDIVYMFWAIAVGLTCGSGFFSVAWAGSFLLAIILIIITYVLSNGNRKPFLIVIRYNEEFTGDLKALLPKYTLKSKTATAKGVELVVEVNLGKSETMFIEDLMQVPGIVSASLVRYSGDYN